MIKKELVEKELVGLKDKIAAQEYRIYKLKEQLKREESLRDGLIGATQVCDKFILVEPAS